MSPCEYLSSTASTKRRKGTRLCVELIQNATGPAPRERGWGLTCPSRGPRSRLAALAWPLHSVDQNDAGADERQEVRTVEPPPAGLRHVEELVGHEEALCARARALRHALAEPHRRETRRLSHPLRHSRQLLRREPGPRTLRRA